MWKSWMVTPPQDNTKVTIELRDLVESGCKIFDFDYPSYYKDQAKLDFERKIIDHYYFRQIGQETPGRWLHYFRSRMREIMPYYIQLYESAELMASVEDPFKAYDLTETYREERSGSGKTNATTSDSSQSESAASRSETRDTEATNERSTTDSEKTKFSDTPQGQISNIDSHLTTYTDLSKDASENATLSEGSEASESSEGSINTSSSGSSETTSEDSGEMSYTLTRQGNIGVQPLGQEIEAYRKALINIDMMVINELKDLFLLVY